MSERVLVNLTRCYFPRLASFPRGHYGKDQTHLNVSQLKRLSRDRAFPSVMSIGVCCRGVPIPTLETTAPGPLPAAPPPPAEA